MTYTNSGTTWSHAPTDNCEDCDRSFLAALENAAEQSGPIEDVFRAVEARMRLNLEPGERLTI